MIRFAIALVLSLSTGLAIAGCRAEVDTTSSSVGIAR
jgi:hypothetical protein